MIYQKLINKLCGVNESFKFYLLNAHLQQLARETYKNAKNITI